MLVTCNTVSSWLCNVCGHLWTCPASPRHPRRCALCRSRDWNSPPPEDPGSELPGA